MAQTHEEHVSLELAYELLAGRVTGERAEVLRRHAVGCARCAAVLREAQAVTAAMRPPRVEPPAGQRERIAEAVARHLGRRRRWGRIAASVAAAALAAAAAVMAVLLTPAASKDRVPTGPPPPQVADGPGDVPATVEVDPSARAEAEAAVKEWAEGSLHVGRAAVDLARHVAGECDVSAMIRSEPPPETRDSSEGAV